MLPRPQQFDLQLGVAQVRLIGHGEAMKGPRGGKAVEQTMTTRAQEAYAGKRARKGKTLEPKLRERLQRA